MTPDRVAPGANRPHCLVCQSIGSSQEVGVIARLLTVEASRLYARLHYGAELESSLTADHVAPGAE